MKQIAKFRILSAFTTFVFAFVVYGAFFSGEGDLLNKAIVEWAWCADGNARCLIEYYVCFGFATLLIGLVIQLTFDLHYKRNWFEKKIKSVSEDKKPETISIKQETSPQKLKITTVTEGKEYSNIQDYASVRVENIGDDEIHCFAKLTKLSMIDRKTIWKPYTGNKIEVFPIDNINPRGSYLQWDDGKEFAILKNGFPHTIRLVDNKASLLFFEAPSYYIFRSDILDGIFRIEIEILEFQNNKFTKIKTVKETLLVRALVQNAKLQGFHFKWEKPNRKKSVQQHET
jgi:hypothetical protein